MKKIFILIVILVIVMFSMLHDEKQFSLRDYFKTGEFTEYSSSIEAKNKKIGESIYFDNLEVGQAIETLNAEIKFVEYLEDEGLTVIYCYSDKIKDSVYAKNEKINLQIASCDNYTVIGWPMILGSF